MTTILSVELKEKKSLKKSDPFIKLTKEEKRKKKEKCVLLAEFKKDIH